MWLTRRQHDQMCRAYQHAHQCRLCRHQHWLSIDLVFQKVSNFLTRISTFEAVAECGFRTVLPSIQGAGSALMGRHTRFEGIVRGMVEVLDCPLTVKMRTGIYKKTGMLTNSYLNLETGGVSLVTVEL